MINKEFEDICQIMNIKKTIYVLKCANENMGLAYESLIEANKYLKESCEKFPSNKYNLERLIYIPRTCSHCNHFELMTIPANEPYSPVYYQCPQCDSTFATSEP